MTQSPTSYPQPIALDDLLQFISTPTVMIVVLCLFPKNLPL
jgi:hypothetical protein